MGTKLFNTMEGMFSNCATARRRSINDVVTPKYNTVFRNHHLKLVAVDMFMRIIGIYDPKSEGKSLSHHFKTCVLRVLVHQGHAYPINTKINEFDQTISTLYEKLQTLPLSTRYLIREDFSCKDDEVIQQFSKIYKYIINYKGTQAFVKIICDQDMEQGLHYFRKKKGIWVTNIDIKANTVSGFRIGQGDTVFKICNLEVKEEDSFRRMDTKEHYELFMKA